jgi:ankyrin repeat protein
MILDRGCSLDVADVDGDTVLHLAARRENNELLAALLRYWHTYLRNI